MSLPVELSRDELIALVLRQQQVMAAQQCVIAALQAEVSALREEAA